METRQYVDRGNYMRCAMCGYFETNDGFPTYRPNKFSGYEIDRNAKGRCTKRNLRNKCADSSKCQDFYKR